MRINSKFKHFFTGGGKEGKEHKITEQDFEKIEKPHVKSKPKKKKKKKYIFDGYICPFCKKELEYAAVSDKPKWFGNWMRKRKSYCKECGALEVKEGCPACHRDIWYHNGMFTHQHSGCGYKGVGVFEDRLKVLEQIRENKRNE